MDLKEPHSLLERHNTAGNAARGQHRLGWYMVSGAVLLIILMVFWLNKLESSVPAQAEEDGTKKEAILDPDGPEIPASALGVTFDGARCIAWHVSGASEIPSPSNRYVIVSSKLLDPFSYTAAGFGKECEGRVARILVTEDIKQGQLEEIVSKIKPAAVIAVGEASADMVMQSIPGMPVLYAMILSPEKAGLNKAGCLGVIPKVPVGVAVRRMLATLPLKAKNIGVVYAIGSSSHLATDALEEIKTLGRKGTGLGLKDQNGTEKSLKNLIQKHDALLVLVDGTIINEKVLQRLMVIAENNRIPVCVSDERHVMMGAYVGIGVDSYRIGKQLCHLAGALERGQLPKDGHVFCPEYSFAVLNNAVIEKLGYMLDPEQFKQVKLYKWN